VLVREGGMAVESGIQRLRIAVGWFTLFIIGTDLFVVSPLLPSIAHRFSITPSTAGLMVAAFSIMYAIGAPLFGALSDRMGKRMMIFIGLLGFTVGNALTGLVLSFPLLIASRVLAGLSAAAVTPSIYAITGDVAPAEGRGGWLAIVGSGLLMALWAGAPIGTLVAQIIGWQVVFVGLAIISLVLMVLNQRVWPKSKPVQSGISGGSARSSLRTVLADVSVTALWGAAVYGLYTYLGTGLRLYDHFSTGLVAATLIVFGIGVTAGVLYWWGLAGCWGASRVSTVSLVGLGILLAVVGLLFHTGAWLFPVFILWSFVGYAFFPAFQARLAKEFSDRRGMAMAWNNTALYVGITLGSLIGGWVITKWPFGDLPFICAVIALLGGALSFIRTTRIFTA